MMKVTLVTIIDNPNIGTYLQAYALSTVIKKGGHDVKILNYRRKRQRLLPYIKRIWREKKSNPVQALFAILYKVLTVNITRNRLHNFLTEHAVVTGKYYHKDLFSGAEQDADIYIAGSDQVWNSSYNNGIDEIFYLDFVRGSALKVAYAASIGNDEFGDEEKYAVSTMLKKFKSVSVRETQSIEALYKIGIEGAVHVLDPTMLISKDEWVRLAEQDCFTKTEPYLLVYSVEVENKQLLGELAKEIAQERGLKVYVVTSGWFRERISCDKVFYFAKPERLLALFHNADFVLVSSFHGTVFSLNLGKDFLSVSPPKYNSRVGNLLVLLGLEYRIVVDGIITKAAFTPIDYDSVNEKIGVLRNGSITYLNKALS